MSIGLATLLHSNVFLIYRVHDKRAIYIFGDFKRILLCGAKTFFKSLQNKKIVANHT